MPEGIVLGFDVGTKRMGTAVGNTISRQATPLKTLSVNNGQPDWTCIGKLIKEWRPKALIVGIPVNLDDTEQPITLIARRFCEDLSRHFALPVYPVDERLTTVEARAQLFSQGGYRKIQQSEVDSYAAKLIVEQWLMDIV